MRYLVDTHTLLWALGDVGALSPAARDAIAAPSNLIFVSSASLWECAMRSTDEDVASPGIGVGLAQSLSGAIEHLALGTGEVLATGDMRRRDQPEPGTEML